MGTVLLPSLALRGHFIAEMGSQEADSPPTMGSKLQALDRYWSERISLVSTHHHRELAAAQSAVEQVRQHPKHPGGYPRRLVPGLSIGSMPAPGCASLLCSCPLQRSTAVPSSGRMLPPHADTCGRSRPDTSGAPCSMRR